MRFVTDTHCLLWHLQDHPRLSQASKRLFDDPQEAGQVVIPTIALAELIYILRKIRLRQPAEEIIKRVESEDRFEIHPLSLAIVHKMIRLDHFEIHDSLIVGTALHLDLPLMTRDQKIVDARIVQTLRP